MTRTIVNINGAPSVVLGTMGTMAFYHELQIVVYELRWLLLATVVLVCVDFFTGLADSVKIKGDDFRFSRAGRRTFVKLIEYFGYLLIGLVIGKGITEPLGICDYVKCSAVVSLFAVVWEIDSIKDHVCSLHGIENKISVKKLIISLLKRKSPDIGEAVEEAWEDKDKEEK